MNLLEEQRERQRAEDRENREWRDKQAERDRQWRQEDVAAAEKVGKQASRRHLVNILVLGFLMILAQFVAAYIGK